MLVGVLLLPVKDVAPRLLLDAAADEDPPALLPAPLLLLTREEEITLAKRIEELAQSTDAAEDESLTSFLSIPALADTAPGDVALENTAIADSGILPMTDEELALLLAEE